MEQTTKAKGLDAFFGITRRGSTVGREICAGLLMGILSVCGIFMNMQLMSANLLTGSSVAANGEIIAGLYFFSMLAAFAGSLLIGLVARLPLVQASGLGLGSVLISMAGAAEGLTYYNLLLVSLLSAAVCALALAVPAVWRGLWAAVPEPVRRAVPAAAGLLLAWNALQLTGVVTVGATAQSTYGVGAVLEQVSPSVSASSFVPFSSFSYATDKFHPLMLLSALSVLLAFVIWLYCRRRSTRPYLNALLAGTAFFLLTNLCFVCVNWKNFGMSLDSLWGRLWAVGSEDALHHHFYAIFSQFAPAKVLTEGLDFSAYAAAGGSPALFVVTGVITMAFTSLFDAKATFDGVAAQAGQEQENDRAALLCGAVCGVAAPLVGVGPLGLSKASVAGAGDGARTGLASVSAALVQLVSAFVWVVPFFFATLYSYDIKFTMYGHYGETLQALSQCSFAVADAVMVIAGLSMAVRAMGIRWDDVVQAAPFAATAAAAFFLSSLAAGVAAGSLVWLLTAAGKEQRPTAARWGWCAVSVVLLALIMW